MLEMVGEEPGALAQHVTDAKTDESDNKARLFAAEICIFPGREYHLNSVDCFVLACSPRHARQRATRPRARRPPRGTGTRYVSASPASRTCRPPLAPPVAPAAEPSDAPEAAKPEKRGRGRPKGSKNKPRGSGDASEAAPEAKRKRGRPRKVRHATYIPSPADRFPGEARRARRRARRGAGESAQKAPG